MAHDFRHCAADAGIHFVEDHRCNAVLPKHGDFDGQADARKFSAGSHLAQRPQGLAGIGADLKLGALDAFGMRLAITGRCKVDGKTPARHAERSHAVADFLPQSFSGSGACGGNLRCQCSPCSNRSFAFAFQPREGFAAVGKRIELRLQFITSRCLAIRRHAMAAGKLVQAGKFCVQFGEAFRVEIKVIAQAVQCAGGFIQLDCSTIEQGVDFGQTWFVIHQPRQFRTHAAQAGKHRAIAGQGFSRAPAAFDQRGGMGLTAMRGDQFFDGRRRKVFACQLLHLPRQLIAPLRGIAPATQFVDLAVEPGPVPCRFAHCGESFTMIGGGIEQAQLPATLQQRLMRVLAVDFHQQRAKFGQLRGGGRPPVDVGTRAAIGADRATQEAFAILVQIVAAQPFQCRGIGSGRETRREFRALRPGPHHACIRALAGEQQQCIHQQGFTRAGFAGNHRQTGGKPGFHRTDDGEILDVERNQHGVVDADNEAARTLSWAAIADQTIRFPGLGFRRHAAISGKHPLLRLTS